MVSCIIIFSHSFSVLYTHPFDWNACIHTIEFWNLKSDSRRDGCSRRSFFSSDRSSYFSSISFSSPVFFLFLFSLRFLIEFFLLIFSSFSFILLSFVCIWVSVFLLHLAPCTITKQTLKLKFCWNWNTLQYKCTNQLLRQLIPVLANQENVLFFFLDLNLHLFETHTRQLMKYNFQMGFSLKMEWIKRANVSVQM